MERGRAVRGWGRGIVLHVWRYFGGGAAGKGRGAVFRPVAVVGFDIFSCHRGTGSGGGKPLLSHENAKDWAPRQEVLEVTLDTEALTISVPLRELRDLQARLEEWWATRETTTVREVPVLAGKLHRAAFVVRPGRCFVRRLLQLNVDEKGRGWKDMGKTSEESGGEHSIEAVGRICGGRGVVEMVRTAREHQERGEHRSSVLSVRDTGTGEDVFFRRTP